MRPLGETGKGSRSNDQRAFQRDIEDPSADSVIALLGSHTGRHSIFLDTLSARLRQGHGVAMETHSGR